MSELNFGILVTLFDKASEPIRGIARSIGDTSKTVGEGAKEFDKLGKSGKAAVSGIASGPIRGVSKSIGDTSKSAKEGAKEFDKLGKSGKAAFTGMAVTSKGAADGVTDITEASTRLEKAATRSFDAGEKSANKFRTALSKIGLGIKELAGDTDKLRKLRNSFNDIKSAGTKGMFSGMTAAGAVAGLAALASNSESRLNDISLPLMRADGTSRLDPFRGDIESQARFTGRSALDVTDAVAGALAENMSEAAIKGGGLKAIMDLSVVNKISERTAGELLAKAGGNFKISDTEFDYIADYMNRAAQAGNTNFESMAGIVSGLGERAKRLGIDGARGLQAVTLLTTQFKMSGMDDSAAASSLDSLMGALPTLGSKVMHSKSYMAGEFKSILSNHGIGDISKTLFNDKGELRGDDGAEKMFNLAKVFGEISEKVTNTEERLTLFKVLMPGASEEAAMRLSTGGWNSAAKTIYEDHLNLEDQAAKKREESAQKWMRLTTAVRGLASTIGKQVLPTANKFMDTASKVIGKVTDWTEAHPGLVKVMAVSVGVGGLLLAGVSALAFGIGLLGNTITSTITGFGTWKGYLSSAKTWVKGLGTEAAISNAELKSLNVTRLKGLYAPTAQKMATAIPLGGVTKNVGKLKGATLSRVAGKAGARIIPIAAAGAASIAPAIGTAGTAASAGGAVGGAGTAVGSTLGGITGAMSSIPGLGWAIAGALALSAILIVKYWEPIKATFEGTLKGLKYGWTQWASPAIGELKLALWGVWDAISGILDIFSPFKTEQDAVNAGLRYGATQGIAFMGMLTGVVHAAKFAVNVLEGLFIAVAGIVDGISWGAKLAWQVSGNQWAEAAKTASEWRGVKDRAEERWNNASWTDNSKRRLAKEAKERAAKYEALVGTNTEEKHGTAANAKAIGGRTFSEPNAAPPTTPTTQEQIETLVTQGVNPEVLVQMMQPKQAAKPNTITIHYNPQITLTGSATADDERRLMAVLKKHKEELYEMLNEVGQKRMAWT